MKQVARIAGVSVRTLHYYDEIGLLTPATRSAAGYRLYEADDLLRHMAHDKKVRDGRPVLVLVRGIGQAFLHDQATNDQILSVLEAAVAA